MSTLQPPGKLPWAGEEGLSAIVAEKRAALTLVSIDQ
jgi:hypothetical protein